METEEAETCNPHMNGESVDNPDEEFEFSITAIQSNVRAVVPVCTRTIAQYCIKQARIFLSYNVQPNGSQNPCLKCLWQPNTVTCRIQDPASSNNIVSIQALDSRPSQNSGWTPFPTGLSRISFIMGGLASRSWLLRKGIHRIATKYTEKCGKLLQKIWMQYLVRR